MGESDAGGSCLPGQCQRLSDFYSASCVRHHVCCAEAITLPISAVCKLESEIDIVSGVLRSKLHRMSRAADVLQLLCSQNGSKQHLKSVVLSSPTRIEKME